MRTPEDEIRLMDERLQAAIDEARRLREAVDQAQDAMVITEYAPIDEPGPRIVWVSGGFERMTGWTSEEVVGRSPRLFQGPDTDRGPLDEVRRALEAGKPMASQTVNYKKDGTPFHLEWSIAPVADADGHPTHWLSVQRDVTERVEAGRQLQLLNDELNHRHKNLFALVGALQNGIPKEGRSADEYHRDLSARMAALSGAHDAVFSGTERAALMSDLVGRGLAPFPQAQVEATGGDARLASTAAVNMSLLLHELATNASKYGALSVPDGRVELSWSMRQGMLWFDWREVGGPEVGLPTRRGFGRKLIDTLTRTGERPDAGLAFDPGGVVCRAAMPVG